MKFILFPGEFFPDPRYAQKRRYPRYFGDFREEDVQTPRGAARALKLGQECVAKLRKTCGDLRSKNLKLKKQVHSMRDTLEELRKLDFDSQTAADVIMVRVLTDTEGGIELL